jgi:hypothetical protein
VFLGLTPVSKRLGVKGEPDIEGGTESKVDPNIGDIYDRMYDMDLCV